MKEYAVKRPVGARSGALLVPTFAVLWFALLARPAGAEDISPPSLRPAEVTDAVESSIERGLDFLARVQASDGSYGKSQYERPGNQVYPTAMTSLAGLCFLASGSTPTRGPYARNLQRITDYLLENCVDTERSAPGLITARRGYEQRPMYCHAFAMTYLGHIFAVEPDRPKRERIRRVLQGGVELLRRTQTDDGGWGYTPNYYDDEGTLVVTQLQALRTCRDAGIFVPKDMIDRAVHYIEISTNPNGSVRYRPTSSRTRPGVTCAAVVALWQAGRYEDPLLRRITDYVERSIEPGHRTLEHWHRGHHAEYVLYYLSQSQHVLGGRGWTRYYRDVSEMLLKVQDRGDGSWEGKDDGDIYGTTIALLILQLPYNRLPVYQR